MSGTSLKQKVISYWNQEPCGTHWVQSEKYSRRYFDEIEDYRYKKEPEIFSFAQFSRFNGKRVLEVGIGAGTDFLQWVRSGAEAYGIDITPESIKHVEKRLDVYGLKAKSIQVADAEKLPFSSDFFDLIYSFGVLHHTPDTSKALSEVVRCVKPGGRAKIMLYNRNSLNTFYLWIWHALLKGRPWKGFASCLYHHMESVGTKGYTPNEVKAMLNIPGVSNLTIKRQLTYYDLHNFLQFRFRKYRIGSFISETIGSFMAWACGGNRVGWWLLIEFTKDKHGSV